MAISNDDQAEEEHDDVIFTPELSKMLKKAKGEHVSDDEMIDEETGEKAVDNYPDAFDDSEEEKETPVAVVPSPVKKAPTKRGRPKGSKNKPKTRKKKK